MLELKKYAVSLAGKQRGTSTIAVRVIIADINRKAHAYPPKRLPIAGESLPMFEIIAIAMYGSTVIWSSPTKASPMCRDTAEISELPTMVMII